MVLPEPAAEPDGGSVVDFEPRRIDLHVAGLSKSFGTGTPVFDDLSFSVRHGEVVALIGANGAGKSTLLRCCVRLIEPTAGTVRLLEQNISAASGASLRRLRRRVGFVFQKHNLVPRLSALSNVVHGALSAHRGPRYWLHGLAPARARERATECLGQVGLAGIAPARADTLSGGQSQRVAIARTLMQSPELIMADEPIASLDPAAGEEVMELFVSLARAKGLTLLFTSHDLRHTLHYADRVIALRGGGVAVDAPASDLNIADLRTVYG